MIGEAADQRAAAEYRGFDLGQAIAGNAMGGREVVAVSMDDLNQAAVFSDDDFAKAIK